MNGLYIRTHLRSIYKQKWEFHEALFTTESEIPDIPPYLRVLNVATSLIPNANEETCTILLQLLRKFRPAFHNCLIKDFYSDINTDLHNDELIDMNDLTTHLDLLLNLYEGRCAGYCFIAPNLTSNINIGQILTQMLESPVIQAVQSFTFLHGHMRSSVLYITSPMDFPVAAVINWLWTPLKRKSKEFPTQQKFGKFLTVKRISISMNIIEKLVDAIIQVCLFNYYYLQYVLKNLK